MSEWQALGTVLLVLHDSLYIMTSYIVITTHTLATRAVWAITRNLAVADKSRDAVQYAMEWLTPLEHALPRVCYYAELGRSTSRGVKTNRGEPKIGERLAAPA